VAAVHQLTWLEEQFEIPMQKADEKTNLRQLSLIALDSEGRKFTNCTALGAEIMTKGDGL
jgi:hypothetical protein